MEIQNISGPDTMPSGFAVRSDMPPENADRDRDEQVRREEIPEQSKGRFVDTYV
jgi:hypothetical protein